ncbi:MAG TPA: DJ-1/PfpI family protein [Thermoanaerobaculia bacterium]|nr:DJ-1/PfpI family protein [Thermoanaerobaculia bacterium]
MNRRYRSLVAGLVLALLAWSAGAAEAPTVLSGFDPVLLVEGKEVKGSEELSEVEGRFRYLFATPENRDRFRADPERFAVQNDGQCAAMPGVPGSPELFTVHAGKLYLFGGESCRRAFEATPGLFIGEIPRRKVAILVFEGVELLDLAGPGEVFAAAGHGAAFEVYTVAATREPVVSQGFLEIKPRFAIADAPPPDLLVVPGGVGVRSLVESPEMMAWIRATAARAEVVLSVCNGAFVLAEAGLLDGLEATTHGSSIEGLRRRASRTRVVEGVRFVDNGRVVTAAGVSAGIDASLHLLARLFGETEAQRTARYLEVLGRGEGRVVPVPAAGGR